MRPEPNFYYSDISTEEMFYLFSGSNEALKMVVIFLALRP